MNCAFFERVTNFREKSVFTWNDLVFLYLDWIWENTDQKKLRIRHFSRIASESGLRACCNSDKFDFGEWVQKIMAEYNKTLERAT